MTRQDYGPTGFTAAHLGPVELHRWHTPGRARHRGPRAGARGEPFVYAYYEGIDKVAHAEGLGEFYDDELRAADRLVADVLEVLPPGAVLVVTADHGQVDVGQLGRGARARDHARRDADQRRGPLPLAARAAGCHGDVAATAAALHGDVAWVRTKEQVIDEGWLGGVPSPGSPPGWATWPWSRSSPSRSSTRPTPASCACGPGTAR